MFFLRWSDVNYEFYDEEFASKEEVLGFIKTRLPNKGFHVIKLVYGLDITDRIKPVEIVKSVDFEVPTLGF